MKNHENGPEQYYVLRHVLKFIPLGYEKGDKFLYITPVYAEKETSTKIKDPAIESGVIK